jgi:hypothetical protein
MVKDLIGISGIFLVDRMSTPFHFDNKMADFVAAIVFFLAARIYDKLKTDRRIDRIETAYEKKIEQLTIKKEENETV